MNDPSGLQVHNGVRCKNIWLILIFIDADTFKSVRVPYVKKFDHLMNLAHTVQIQRQTGFQQQRDSVQGLFHRVSTSTRPMVCRALLRQV